MLFVSMVTVEVKSSDFHYCKKEYSFVWATVQFDLIFLSSARYKNALNTLEVNYHVCRIKSFKWLALNVLKILCNESFVSKLSHATLN